MTSFVVVMLDAASDLIGGPLPKWSWKKASLPASLGSSVDRNVSLYAPAAYLGSLDQSKHLVSRILGSEPSASKQLAPALDDLAINARQGEWSSIEEFYVSLQQCPLSRAIDHAVFDDLYQAAPDSCSKALALSMSIPHAGDWLSAIPLKTLGLHFHDWEYKPCLRYWL